MKTLFYVGRSYPHGDVLNNLKSRGYSFGLFQDVNMPANQPDLFNHIIDLDFSSYETTLSSLIKKTNDLPRIDGLLCTYENYIPAKSIIADHLQLPAMSLSAAEDCTDKFLMRKAFQSYDPSITPDFIDIDSEKTLLDFAKRVGYPLILKPANLSKSILINRCDNKRELIEKYQSMTSQLDEVYKKSGVHRKPHIIAEQFIVGRMCSLAAFVDKNGTAHLCEGAVDLISAQSIGINDNYLYSRKLPLKMSPDFAKKIESVATAGVMALQMKATPAHIEIIYNDQEIKLVEIGARIGGYRPLMYQLGYGINMIEQEIQAAIGNKPDVNGQFKNYTAVYELFPRQQGTFVKLHNQEDSTNYAYFHQVAKPGDQVGTSKDGFKTACVIAVASPDIKSFQKKCREIERISVETS